MKKNIWLEGMMGVIVGDALGCPVQFMSREEILCRPTGSVAGMESGGVYNMPEGTWTDDSSMALATLESIRDLGVVDPEDIMTRFVDWYEDGEYTPFGEAFDMGNTCSCAIEKFEDEHDPYTCGGISEHSNGNGSLMRIMPVCLYAYQKRLSDEDAVKVVHEVSGLTHNHLRAKIACGLYYFCVKEILEENGKLIDRLQNGLRTGFDFYEKDVANHAQISYFERLRNLKAFYEVSDDDIRSTGYVVDSIEAAIWSLIKTSSFKECLLTAVNMGDDTDTIGAIAGGLAALYYGYDEIPLEWLEVIQKKEWIGELCRMKESQVVIDSEENKTGVNSEKSRGDKKSSKQKLFDMINNNILGERNDMSNDIVDAALEEYMNKPGIAASMAVQETIRVRMHCRAQFVVPTPTQPDGSTGLGMIRDDKSHTDFFVAYTGIDKMDPMAGPHSMSMGMKRYMESVLASSSDGIYLNPRTKGNGFSFRMTGYQLFLGDLLKVLRSYYNPAYRMESVKGDITNLEVDAIVNAANNSLLGGGGVDGAIHRAAGKELLEECRKLGGCETGEAKITEAYKLHAKKIIHTVGPIYSGTEKDKELLANCYRNSLELAKENHLHTIAFPGISTGVYGYPVEEAARIAYDTVLEWLTQNKLIPLHVIFVSFNDEAKDIYDSLTDDYKDFIIKT